MAEPRRQKQYALDMLHAFSEHRNKTKRSPHPVDQAEVIAVGSDDGDIRLKLFNSDITLDGDECQFLVDETFLEKGDMVGVVFDASGDPIVIAAAYQNDPYVTATGPVNLNPTGMHVHAEKTFVPTAPQTSFPMPTIFDSEQVYVNGLRLSRGIGYSVNGRRVVLTTPAAASSVVQVDYQTNA